MVRLPMVIELCLTFRKVKGIYPSMGHPLIRKPSCHSVSGSKNLVSISQDWMLGFAYKSERLEPEGLEPSGYQIPSS